MFTESSQICFIKYSRVSATSHTSTIDYIDYVVYIIYASTNIKSRIKYNKNRLTKVATQHTANNNITIASKTSYSYIKTRLTSYYITTKQVDVRNIIIFKI